MFKIALYLQWSDRVPYVFTFIFNVTPPAVEGFTTVQVIDDGTECYFKKRAHCIQDRPH